MMGPPISFFIKRAS